MKPKQPDLYVFQHLSVERGVDVAIEGSCVAVLCGSGSARASPGCGQVQPQLAAALASCGQPPQRAGPYCPLPS